MAAGEQRGDEKMDVNPAQPRPQSLRSSSKARASASDANSAEGSAWRSERITLRSFKLPHASSPEIQGCIRTALSESRSANLGLRAENAQPTLRYRPKPLRRPATGNVGKLRLCPAK